MLLNIISGFQIEPQIKKTVTKYNKLTTEIIINIHKVVEEVWVQNLEKQAFTSNFRFLLHVHSAPQRTKPESTKTNGDFYNVEICSCILYFPTFNCLDVVLHLAHDHNCNVGSRERKEAHKKWNPLQINLVLLKPYQHSLKSNDCSCYALP